MVKKDSRKSSTGSHVIDIEEAQEERRRKRQEAASSKRRQKRAKKTKEKEPSEEIVSHSTPESRKKKRKKAGRTKRFLIFVIVIGVLAFVGMAVAQVISLNLELKEAEEIRAQKQAEKVKMTKELDRVNDPEYIEEQARKRLRMIRQGEILYVFPKEEEDNSE